MADLDNDLSRRLSRLAAAVPTARLDPAHLRAVEARHRVRMAWMTPLVALVVVVIGAALLGGGNQFGSDTITATSRSGDFELTIRSAKPSYSADEPIVIEAALLYDGPEDSVRITHGGGAAGGPLGFGTIEPVIGSLRLGTVFDMARHSTDLEQGRPLTVPFTKGAGSFGNDPLFDQYAAYLEDPVLRLPPGTWHLVATAGLGGPEGDVGLRAVIEILVTPAATSGPVQATPFTNGPVTNSVTSGPFVLAMRSAKVWYEASEPIEITAALTYVGQDGSIDIRHASGARGSPLGFGIEEPVLGELRLGPGWDMSCVSTTLHADIPVDQEFMKSSGWSTDDPRAAEYHEFIVSSGLRLPAGTWHVYAVAEFTLGDCAADPIKIRVDIVLEVGSPADVPSALLVPNGAGADRWRSIALEGDFELGLEAAKATFASDEPLEVTASLVYRGPEERVVIGHALSGPIEFSMSGSGVNLIPSGPRGCLEIDLDRGATFPVRLVALGVPHSPFRVTHGLYEIGGLGDFRIGGCDAPQATIRTSIVVAVVDGPDDIPLFTDHSGVGACLLLRNGGRLAASDTGLGVVKLDGRLREVVWPAGYSARHSPDGALLIGADGQVVAREGDQVEFDAYDPAEGPLHPCGEVELDARVIQLWTAAQPTDECNMARGGGALASHPESGLGVRQLFEDVMAVRWPFGYTARMEAIGAALLDTQARVVAREGDEVTLTGGAIETGDGGFFACKVATP